MPFRPRQTRFRGARDSLLRSLHRKTSYRQLSVCAIVSAKMGMVLLVVTSVADENVASRIASWGTGPAPDPRLDYAHAHLKGRRGRSPARPNAPIGARSFAVGRKICRVERFTLLEHGFVGHALHRVPCAGLVALVMSACSLAVCREVGNYAQRRVGRFAFFEQTFVRHALTPRCSRTDSKASYTQLNRICKFPPHWV